MKMTNAEIADLLRRINDGYEFNEFIAAEIQAAIEVLTPAPESDASSREIAMEKMQSVTIRFPQDWYILMKELADANNMTVAEWVRTVVGASLKRKGHKDLSQPIPRGMTVDQWERAQAED